MKKGLKIAGAVAGIAALATLVPYYVNKDTDNDETTVQALLWKYTNKPDYDAPSGRKISIDIGFNNPFKADNEYLMDDCDDPILDCSPVEAAPEAPAEEPAEAECAPEVTESDCEAF